MIFSEFIIASNMHAYNCSYIYTYSFCGNCFLIFSRKPFRLVKCSIRVAVGDYFVLKYATEFDFSDTFLAYSFRLFDTMLVPH